MQPTLCMRYFVSGKVQGVWFRASTQRVAMEVGVKGWVRNCPDGRVEVFACGSEESLMQLQEWLKQGPELAEVTEVLAEPAMFEQHERFAIK